VIEVKRPYRAALLFEGEPGAIVGSTESLPTFRSWLRPPHLQHESLAVRRRTCLRFSCGRRIG